MNNCMKSSLLNDCCRPYIVDRYRVHLNSRRSYIVDTKPDNDSLRPPRLACSINGDGGKVLSFCSGESTLSQIISQLGFLMESQEAKQIVEFINHTIQEGYVAIDPHTSFPIERQFTGSLDKYIPAHVSIEVTGQCNLKCNYCYHGDLDAKYNSSNELSFDQLIATLDDWRELGLLSVELTGGEPTLYKHFIPLLDYCMENFSLIAILTNGTNIDSELLSRLASTKSTIFVSVSLDSRTPTIFSKITKASEGVFYKVIRGIQDIVKTGVQTNVTMSVTSDNVHEVYDLAVFVNSLGVKGFAPAVVASVGYGFTSGWEWNIELSTKYSDQVARIKSEYPGFLTNLAELSEKTGPIDRESSNRCDIGKRVAVISPDGEIRPCLMVSNKWSTGSVKLHSIKDILLGENYQQLADLEFPPTKACWECIYKNFCVGCVVTPLSVAEKEGKRCEWWNESGLADWIRKHGDLESIGESATVKNFSDRTPARHCNRCPKIE